MLQIKSIDLKLLHQEEDFGFHKLMLIETAKCKNAKVVPRHTEYAEAFAHFDEVLKPGGKDPMTALVAKGVNDRNGIYTGMSGQARCMLKHFNPDKVAIAQGACDIIDKYDDPRPLAYIKASGVIENLIQDLKVFDNEEEEDRPTIESADIVNNRLSVIYLKEWVDELERLNNNFIKLFSDRNAAQAAIITGASKEAREEADKAFRALVRRVNALIETDGEDDFKDMVSKMNELIDYQQTTLNARATRNAKKKKDDRPPIE